MRSSLRGTVVPGHGVGFWLEASDLEPADDPAWKVVPQPFRTRFWDEAIRTAKDRYEASREAGLGADGDDLAALADYTIAHRRSAMGEADPDAPPFVPAHERSRTVAYLEARYEVGRGAWFSWRDDPETGGPWGVILGYHRDGMVPGAPARDVIGLSDADIEAIKARMGSWWESRREAFARQAAEEAANLPELTLRAAPLPKLRTAPEPVPPPSDTFVFSVNEGKQGTGRGSGWSRGPIGGGLAGWKPEALPRLNYGR